VSSRVGQVEVPVEISDEIMPGVVSLPHGWGHNRPGSRLRVASQTPGVSINDLTDPARVDSMSGVAALSATVERNGCRWRTRDDCRVWVGVVVGQWLNTQTRRRSWGDRGPFRWAGAVKEAWMKTVAEWVGDIRTTWTKKLPDKSRAC
jgi:Molydopterin dinucleotide binding domain